uniref:NADH-ubiquinone oxidoreductase chain 4 n=1 Tax=Stylosomus rugithorax TaxID=1425630 RepID=A0A3G1GQ36_9CUCU|nr:NADH dehydrogenase subunit 4 [Stylosomus rugithorax]
MMKFILFSLFLIPLILANFYWLVVLSFFSLTFIFLLFMDHSLYFCHISSVLGCDLLSFLMISLSLWICSLMFLASLKIYKMNNYSELFAFLILLLFISLFLTFSSMNLFFFYLFFEISLIPTLMLIVGWGYQPERLEAGLYLLFYTLVFSLPMMVAIFYLYYKSGSLIFFKLSTQLMNWYSFFCMNMVFFVKMPMYFLHLWLPKAHVEAPVSGSMILAGVMLKLGGYGLMRFMKLFLLMSFSLNWLIMVISLIGGVVISLICLRQSDIKSLIAYSSVAHMGLVLGGVMTLSTWGFSGALVLMLGHGLCSSGLFALSNIFYERFASRSLYLNKGIINIMPGMTFWFFVFSASNMAAPPSLNLLGEICLINSIVSYSFMTMVFLMLISFFSAVYSLYLYSFTQHGSPCSGSYSFYGGGVREYLMISLHYFPLNILILKADFLFAF